MKKFLCLCLVVIMTLSLSGCVADLAEGAFFLYLIAAGDDRADQDDIFEFVRENEAEMLAAIEKGEIEAFGNRGVVKTVHESEMYIKFSCGGAGVGSGTSYVGFYYTANGSAAVIGESPSFAEKLVPCGNGFEWRETDGDNRYYTEQICGHFWYYEESF